MDDFVRPMIQRDRVTIKGGPYMMVLDYHWDGNRVVNRRYKLRYNLGIGINFFSDPSVDLDLTILVEYSKPGKAIITSTLTDWYTHVHVPWDATAVVSAEEIMKELKNAIALRSEMSMSYGQSMNRSIYSQSRSCPMVT